MKLATKSACRLLCAASMLSCLAYADDKTEINPDSVERTERVRTLSAQSTEPTASTQAQRKPNTADAVSKPKPPPIRPPLRPKRPPSPITANLMTSAVPPLPQKIAPYSGNQNNTDDEATFEPNELMLISNDMDEAKKSANYLNRYGARIKIRSVLSGLGFVLSVFRLPQDADTQALIRQIQMDSPNLQMDVNQRYQLQSAGRESSNRKISSRKSYGATLIQWPQTLNCIAQSSLHLGVIDTQVNTTHPALLGAQVKSQSFIKGKPANAKHGTAVVSMLVGNTQAGFSGLLPKANISAAGVFRARGDKVEATTGSLLLALNWLVEQRVSVINLSLGGEHNRVLEQAITRVLAKDIEIVAAAGNSGPDAP
ncbi:MAG: hypothetical protein COA42_19630, partial [Alteromonadaceae bacterium]